MSPLSLPWNRTRSRQNTPSLSLPTQVPEAGTMENLSPLSPVRTRNRLRKRPRIWNSPTNVASTPKLSAAYSRGTLGGFYSMEGLETQWTPKLEQKASGFRNVGRRIGLGLHLQSDSPTDLAQSIDGTEIWYLSYPPPSPKFPETGVDYLDDQVEVEHDLPSEVEDDTSSVISEDDTSSMISASSAYKSSISLFSDNAIKPALPSEAIVSAQALADQYRNLLSRAPTPGPCLILLPSHEADILAPLPLNTTQNRKKKRPSRRLSQRTPPRIPPRQHFKLPPPAKSLRKMRGYQSLQEHIDLSEYENFFKSSRLSECSTLVSSRENTPLPTPRADRKDVEAFPQMFEFEIDRSKTPQVPLKAPERALSINRNSWRVPCEMLDYAGVGLTVKRHGCAEWEVWI